MRQGRHAGSRERRQSRPRGRRYIAWATGPAGSGRVALIRGELHRLTRTRSVQTATEAPPRRPLRGTLYLAAIAAAEASLRLHETDRVKHWLARGARRAQGLGVELPLRAVGSERSDVHRTGRGDHRRQRQPRWTAAGNRRRRRDGIAVGREDGGHYPYADRAHRGRLVAGVLAGRPPPRNRIVGRIGPHLGCGRRQPVADVSGQRAWCGGRRVAPGAASCRRELVEPVERARRVGNDQSLGYRDRAARPASSSTASNRSDRSRSIGTDRSSPPGRGTSTS